MATAIVPPPTSFTYRSEQPENLTWSLSDDSGNPISGATVLATLYANRSLTNPSTIPGTPVTGFTNILLPESSTPGTYATVINPFSVSSSVTQFVTVIQVTSPGTYTWEIPSVVIPPQNSIDLVTLDQVKSWLALSSTQTSNDALLQFLITSFSQYVIDKTGIASFNQVQQYVEIQDGNGQTRLFVQNRPIQSVVSLIVGSYSVPQSTALTTPGWYIEQDQRSIALRFAPGYINVPQILFPSYFIRGQGNIQVTYTAGYTSVPFDLQEAAMEAVGYYYKRKDWIGILSKTIETGNGRGTVAYAQYSQLPQVKDIINYYSRYARP